MKQSQDALKEKEKDIQQVQTQLKTTQGSFSEEVKKLQSQVTDLQTAEKKKVSEISDLKSMNDLCLRMACLHITFLVCK